MGFTGFYRVLLSLTGFFIGSFLFAPSFDDCQWRRVLIGRPSNHKWCHFLLVHFLPFRHGESMVMDAPLHGDDLLLLVLEVEHVGRVGQLFVAAGGHGGRQFRRLEPTDAGQASAAAAEDAGAGRRRRWRRRRRRRRLYGEIFGVLRRSRTGDAVRRVVDFLGRLHPPLPPVDRVLFWFVLGFHLKKKMRLPSRETESIQRKRQPFCGSSLVVEFYDELDFVIF